MTLHPRAERCPEPDCTDEQQCWRCDYEESQEAAAAAVEELNCLRAKVAWAETRARMWATLDRTTGLGAALAQAGDCILTNFTRIEQGDTTEQTRDTTDRTDITPWT